MNRLRQYWDELRGSFWLLPTCLVLAAGLLAIVLVEVDQRFDWQLEERFPRVFATGAEGAQGILQAIATSMITVAGVIFSITILILNEASNQYSPRIIRNFIRDRGNQFVLGAFLAIFAYCLIVLRAIRGSGGDPYVPPISVFGGMVLALIGIGVLIFFIHHIAYSIQASTILQRAAAETLAEINHLYPEAIGRGVEEVPRDLPAELQDPNLWHPVNATESGYLEYMDADTILKFAEERDVVVRLQYEIGDFVVEGLPLAHVFGRDPLTESQSRKLRRGITIGSYRTVEQDITFGIRELVDIALRALSPTLNDTTTAVMCIHHLTTILARLIQRKMDSPHRFTDSCLRVIAPRPSFEDLVRGCFDQIRQNARGNVSVLRQLVRAVTLITPLTENRSRLSALREQLEMVREVVESSIPSVADQRRLLIACDEALNQLRVAMDR